MTLVGSQLGQFAIVGPIGSGAMGDVYRARDTRLGRDVALKILPAAFAQDQDRRVRFEREARLLAALHHPHIATIFGVEDAGGSAALVMELVEGPTLAERLDGQKAKGKGLSLAAALAIARQLAEALDAAHEKGIIHRDLKPANIKVTPDGVVKVLDFGLAMVAQGSGLAANDETMPLVSTAGSIVGTAAYMSPEQARGQAVDRRTDIWAFGCVLFEMLTGQRAFGGQTGSDVIANVLHKDPDWSALPASTPAAVRQLIARCLEKDQKRRIRDIGDVHFEFQETSSSSIDVRPVAAAGRLPGWSVVPWLLLVVAAGAIYVTRGRNPSGNAVRAPTPEALTNDPGYTGEATLSPDGRLLAFASDRSGRGDLDIWMQQIAGGLPLRITDDEADDHTPDFSPDGSQIVFRSERDGGGIYVVPALGGAARLVARGGRNPRFSPDGSRVAYWTGQFRGETSGRRSELYVIALAGGTPVRMMADFPVANTPVWSPDGRALLVLGLRELKQVNQYDWWYAPMDGSAPVRTGIMDWQTLRADADLSNVVFPGPWTASGFVVADRGNVLVFSLDAQGRPSGPPRALMSGVGSYGTPTMSRDEQTVFTSFTPVRAIERLPLGPVADAATQLFMDSNTVGWRASSTRDGSMIVFERLAGGRLEIWRKSLMTGEQRLVMPVQSRPLVDATVSPDGARLTYVIANVGSPDFGAGFTAEISGGVPKPVCQKCSLWGFTPDSRRAILTDEQSIQFLADSGATQTVLTVREGRVDRPFVAPDGRAIAFRVAHGAKFKTFVTPFSPAGSAASSGWTQIDEPTVTGRPCGWSPDSSLLYLLLDADGFRDLWGQKIDALGHVVGNPYVVRHLHHTNGVSTSFGNAITTQGFLYETTKFTGNLWHLAPQAVSR